jgi:hypothetical protein
MEEMGTGQETVKTAVPGPVKIGSYAIERELGRGGMGAVYVGVHEVIGKRAAVKVLVGAAATDEDLVQRFVNEARAASAIRHPGIVEVYDYGVDEDGRAYLVMELLEGESLAARMKAHGQLAIPAAVAIARRVALALGAAHEAGIIHRDLKPDNVFLDGERVVLLDFGIAKLMGAGPGVSGARTVTGALLGTPQYMSPEQCEGAREVDHRSDLYSLGCTLYQMLTGRLPFEANGVGGWIGAHLHVAPPPLDVYCPAASPELAAIVARLLAKAPDDRFRSGEDLAAALSDPAASRIAPPPPIPPTPAAASLLALPAARRGAPLSLVLLLAALAIGLGVVLLIKSLGGGDGDPPPPPPQPTPRAMRDEVAPVRTPDAPIEKTEKIEKIEKIEKTEKTEKTAEIEPVPEVKPEPKREPTRKDDVKHRARPQPREPKVVLPEEPKPTRTGIATDAETRAILSSRDPAATLALCRAHPPDRPATIRPCVLAACALDEIAQARAWVRAALRVKWLQPHAVDVMNECGKRLLPP